MALLDSGCTKTVVGELWVSAYLDILNEEEKKMVTRKEVRSVFRFGDGKEFISKASIKFPAHIGSKHYFIEADIIENEIPLLLSRDSMKKADMILNFSNDSALFCGEKVDLVCIESGHYCLPLTKFILSDDTKGNQVHITLLSTAEKLKSLSRKEKSVKALKLHKQFSHATEHSLVKLVRNSKQFEDDEFIEEIEKICRACEICDRRRPKPLPPIEECQ